MFGFDFRQGPDHFDMRTLHRSTRRHLRNSIRSTTGAATFARLGRPRAADLDLEDAARTMPSRREVWIGLHGPPIGSFRLHRAVLNPNEIAEIEPRRRIV